MHRFRRFDTFFPSQLPLNQFTVNVLRQDMAHFFPQFKKQTNWKNQKIKEATLIILREKNNISLIMNR